MLGEKAAEIEVRSVSRVHGERSHGEDREHAMLVGLDEIPLVQQKFQDPRKVLAHLGSQFEWLVSRNVARGTLGTSASSH